MKEIEVDLIGDGTNENSYRPNLPHKYFRYIDDHKTLENVDTERRKITVYFIKEIEITNEGG